MKRSDIKILIIEDDSTMSQALQEAFRRNNYGTRVATNPDEAMAICRQGDYKLAIVDCLLPKSSGVDLAANLKAATGEDFKIILISGIYKDKGFIRDAINKTGAVGFLSKPFNIDEILSLVESTFSDEIEPDLPPLLETLVLKEIDSNHRQRVTENLGNLHGFDLPLVYSVIFGSSLSGHLTITDGNGQKSILHFQSGLLTQVQIEDSTSYFGTLIVEMGFASVEDIESVLEQNSTKLLGERLVAAHSLSPHAVRLVLEEQMLLRLSKTIQDGFYEVAFSHLAGSLSDFRLDRDRFSLLLWDWANSKISVEWLKSFYSRWLDYPVLLGEHSLLERRLAALHEVRFQIASSINLVSASGEQTLNEIIEAHEGNEDKILPGLHYLLIEKLAHFGPRKKAVQDTEKKIHRLKRLLADAQGQNYFQVLGVSPKAQGKEITRNYLELAKIYHPDRLEPQAAAEIRKLTAQYFSRVNEAHEVLKDPVKLKEYARELKEGSAEKILQNEESLEQGIGWLKKGKYKMAHDIFARLTSQGSHQI
jgi:ActR/RegA family two-component response regulator